MSSKKGANEHTDSSFKSEESKPEWAGELEERISELEDQNSNAGHNRRDVLKAGGVLGLGTLLGGGGATALTKSVDSAEASHGADYVGEESAPVDVYAHDIIGANSVDTDELSNVQIVDPELGDGASDATQGIKDAINNAGANGMIFVPPGTYMVDVNELELLDGQTLAGAGRGASTIRAEPIDLPDAAVVLLLIEGASGDYFEDNVVRDITLDFNKDNHTGFTDSNSHEVIDTQYCRNLTLENVSTINCTSEGVDLDYTEQSLITGHISRDCGGYGVHVSTQCQQNRISDSISVNCGHNHNRAGFDQYGGSGDEASDNEYVNLASIDCYQGFVIEGFNGMVSNVYATNSVGPNMRLRGSDHEINGAQLKNSQGTSNDGANLVASNGPHSIFNVHAEGGYWGMQISADGTYLGNCTAKDTTDNGILIGSGTVDIMLLGCAALGAGNHGIELVGGEQIALGCTGLNNGNAGIVVRDDNCLVGWGRYQGNSGDNILDQGTGNTTTPNIT